MNQSTFKLITISTCFIACATAHADITWLKDSGRIDVGWYGGAPINGVSSFHDSVSYDRTPAGGSNVQSFGSEGRFGYSFHSLLDDVGEFANLNTQMVYSGFWSPGVPDTSTRFLTIDVEMEYIFSTPTSGYFNCYKLTQNISPFTYCVLEQGTWNGSTFTSPSQVMDFTTITGTGASAHVGQGDFRYRAAYQATIEVNSSYNHHNSSAWNFHSAVPEPGTMAAVGFGGLALLRSRRKKA